ncbi:unnamed protein product [Ilex paraguariensis]|uniref:Uncharacterized protein n=1 Tax=Ilex paraguariensis TaxID=185542 RepID=A0ABC8SBK3_9AQUA
MGRRRDKELPKKDGVVTRWQCSMTLLAIVLDGVAGSVRWLVTGTVGGASGGMRMSLTEIGDWGIKNYGERGVLLDREEK